MKNSKVSSAQNAVLKRIVGETPRIGYRFSMVNVHFDPHIRIPVKKSIPSPSRFLKALLIAGLSLSPTVTILENLHAASTFEGVNAPIDVVDDVVIPVPSEVFNVLDKLGRPNWKAQIRSSPSSNVTDRTLLALRFGVAVAEGFIAVQAEDSEAVDKIGREVLNLATSLGLKNDVQAHAQSILDSAKSNQWNAIRKELDRTQKTVRDTMNRMRDEPLAQCVSIGGWLRGTEAATNVILLNYSAERAELLNQKLLIEHFASVIDSMPGPVKKNEILVKSRQRLKTAVNLVPNKGSMPENSVKELNQICAELIQDINK